MRLNRMKIVSDTVADGEWTGSQYGKKTTTKVRVVRQGPDRFTQLNTKQTVGGESITVALQLLKGAERLAVRKPMTYTTSGTK